MSKLYLDIVIATLIIVIFTWRVYAHRKNLRHLLTLFLNPNAFIASGVENTIKRERQTNAAFKERYDKDEKWKNKWLEDAKQQFSDSAQKLIKGIRLAFITVTLTLLFALGIAFIAADLILLPSNIVSFMQMTSAFLILWSIVGKLGYPIQTIGGQSLPENMDNYWFILLNIAGIFLLFFTQFYSFFCK